MPPLGKLHGALEWSPHPRTASLRSLAAPAPAWVSVIIGACTKGQCWVPHPSPNVQNEVQLSPSLCSLSPGFPAAWTSRHPLPLSPYLGPSYSLKSDDFIVSSISKINTRGESTNPISSPLEDAWGLDWAVISSHTLGVSSSQGSFLLL